VADSRRFKVVSRLFSQPFLVIIDITSLFSNAWGEKGEGWGRSSPSGGAAAFGVAVFCGAVEAIELIIPLFTNWTANSGKISEISFIGRLLHAIALAVYPACVFRNAAVQWRPSDN
jgi:hypothetical protein